MYAVDGLCLDLGSYSDMWVKASLDFIIKVGCNSDVRAWDRVSVICRKSLCGRDGYREN